jgi:hypothetical protein
MNGIIFGKDRIPVIPEQLENLKNYFSGEQLDEASSYV